MVPITFEFVRVGTVKQHYTSFVDMYNARAHICMYIFQRVSVKNVRFSTNVVNFENNNVMDLEENRKS